MVLVIDLQPVTQSLRWGFGRILPESSMLPGLKEFVSFQKHSIRNLSVICFQCLRLRRHCPSITKFRKIWNQRNLSGQFFNSIRCKCNCTYPLKCMKIFSRSHFLFKKWKFFKMLIKTFSWNKKLKFAFIFLCMAMSSWEFNYC